MMTYKQIPFIKTRISLDDANTHTERWNLECHNKQNLFNLQTNMNSSVDQEYQCYLWFFPHL